MVKSNKNKLNLKTKNKSIYLDYAASFLPNPGAIHSEGLKVKDALNKGRNMVAKELGAREEEIVFTSGGTESNNLAIFGSVYALRGKVLPKLPHIITTNIEHSSVLEICKKLVSLSLVELSVVPVEENGIVDIKKIKKEIKENTILISVMYANNEIGTIQPIEEISKMVRHFCKNKFAPNLFFHTDAVQGVNYLNMNTQKLGIDMLSISGAKIQNAGRIGVLFKKSNVPLVSLFGGGEQEFGLRPGTENVEAIIKFAQALKKQNTVKDRRFKEVLKMRDYFIKRLKENRLFLKNKITFNGDLVNRLPNNINITFPNIESDMLVIELSSYRIMASSKSACKSSSEEGSYVIKAINPNLPKDIGGLRFSIGESTKKSDIDYTLKSLEEIITKINKWYN